MINKIPFPERGERYPHKQCPRFDGCSAIFCPMALSGYLSVLRGFLVGEDEICHRVNFATHPLVLKQKRLQRAGAKGLFTLPMVERVRRISKGLHLEDSYGSGPYTKAVKWLRGRKADLTTRRRKMTVNGEVNKAE